MSFGDPWAALRRVLPGAAEQLDAKATAEAPSDPGAVGHRRARPRARIVLVGYPDLFPLSGGCWPAVPITDGDIAYLRGIELSSTPCSRPTPGGRGDLVDTYTPTIGHDFCQPEPIRDVEGLLPAPWPYPFHPNARGQAAIATAVLAALRTS